MEEQSLGSLCLRRAIQRRPGLDFGGLAGACRRGRRPDAGAPSRGTTCWEMTT